MKRLIRNKNTGLFLLEGGGWTPDVVQARVFSSLEEAIRTALEAELEAMELYFCPAE